MQVSRESHPLSPKERLMASGLRVTPQRVLILEILDEAEGHLDAEAVYERARERDERISLATVYRTLAKLKEVGLVEQRYFARDHKREYYESALKAEHYHFTCKGCGKVIEVETARIAQARAELSATLGIEITHVCVCFEGYCAECAAKRRRQREDEHMAAEKEKGGTYVPMGTLTPGQRGRVVQVRGNARFRRRIMEMGVVPGEIIEIERLAPLGDPIEFKVKGYHLSLRKADADQILVERVDGAL